MVASSKLISAVLPWSVRQQRTTLQLQSLWILRAMVTSPRQLRRVDLIWRSVVSWLRLPLSTRLTMTLQYLVGSQSSLPKIGRASCRERVEGKGGAGGDIAKTGERRSAKNGQ